MKYELPSDPLKIDFLFNGVVYVPLLTRVWLDSARAGAGKIVLAVRANSTPTQRLVLAHNEVQIRYICMGNI